MQELITNITTAWNKFSFFTCLLVLIAYTLIDAMYAYYTLSVTDHKEWRSANIGSAMHILLAFGVIKYTENWLYIVPLIIGSWAGTFYVVRKVRLKKEKEAQNPA